jgi:hypothetical protein
MRDWFPDWSAWLSGRRPSVAFREFFTALPQERTYCVPCLSRLSSAPEDAVRRELQALVDRLESQVGRCWTCRKTMTTYHLRPPGTAG